MIPGFESVTESLSEKEIELAKFMAPAFMSRVGKENAITSSQIIKAMAAKGHKLTDTRIRKIVAYLTHTGMTKPISADSNGYYIAANREEEVAHCTSIVMRSMAILMRAKKYECYGEVVERLQLSKIFDYQYSISDK
jgi:hypothetical protein